MFQNINLCFGYLLFIPQGNSSLITFTWRCFDLFWQRFVEKKTLFVRYFSSSTQYSQSFFFLQWLKKFLVWHQIINPLLHRYSFCRINRRQLLKTLWKKEKLLVTSNFSFFPQCFLFYQISVSPFLYIFDIINDNYPY